MNSDLGIVWMFSVIFDPIYGVLCYIPKNKKKLEKAYSTSLSRSKHLERLAVCRKQE